MRARGVLLLSCVLVSAVAQSPQAPTFDPCLTVSAILREDIFAGFMANDDERQLQGEKNIEILLAERSRDRPTLIAWKGAIAFTRAAEANEAKRTGEFESEYKKALDFYSEAVRLDPASASVMAIKGEPSSHFRIDSRCDSVLTPGTRHIKPMVV